MRGNYFGYCIVWFGLIVQFVMGIFVCCRLGGLRFPPNPLKRFSCVYSFLLRSLFGCITVKGLVLIRRGREGRPLPYKLCVAILIAKSRLFVINVGGNTRIKENINIYLQ